MSYDHQIGFQGGRLFAMAWVGVYPMVTPISWLFGGVLLALPLPNPNPRPQWLDGGLSGVFLDAFHPAGQAHPLTGNGWLAHLAIGPATQTGERG